VKDHPTSHFRISLTQLFIVLTIAALFCLALAKASPLTGVICLAVECLLLIGAMTLIPCSSGPRLRFLIAFVGSGMIFEVFNAHLKNYSQFDVFWKLLWRTFSPNAAAPRDHLFAPEPSGYFDFAMTIEPLVGIGLALLSGFVASRVPGPQTKSKS